MGRPLAAIAREAGALGLSVGASAVADAAGAQIRAAEANGAQVRARPIGAVARLTALATRGRVAVFGRLLGARFRGAGTARARIDELAAWHRAEVGEPAIGSHPAATPAALPCARRMHVARPLIRITAAVP